MRSDVRKVVALVVLNPSKILYWSLICREGKVEKGATRYPCGERIRDQLITMWKGDMDTRVDMFTIRVGAPMFHYLIHYCNGFCFSVIPHCT